MRLKLPTKWSNITLGQFIQILDLPETSNKVNDFIYKLSILSGKDSELIKDKVKTKDLRKYGKQLAFMSEMPKARKVNWFLWKFRFYKRLSLDETTSMQVADIMQQSNGESNEGAKMLEVLSTLYYTGKDSEYNSDRHKKMKNEFEDLPFTLAYSSSVFFLIGLTEYFPNVLKVFSNKMQNMTIRQTEDLQEKMQNMKEKKELRKFFNGTIS
tara:strand:+ start:8705 stop:9340 length:636 start_codon:yes stop_codon:yes gene_type:complete